MSINIKRRTEGRIEALKPVPVYEEGPGPALGELLHVRTAQLLVAYVNLK